MMRLFFQPLFDRLIQGHLPGNGRSRRGASVLSGIFRNVIFTVTVQIHKRMICIKGPHHFLGGRIDYPRTQTIVHGHCIEIGIDNRAVRQAKRDIGYSQHRVDSKSVTHFFQCFQRYPGPFRIRTDCHSQNVDDNVFFMNSVFCSFRDNAAGYLHSFVRSIRNAALIQREADDYAPILLYQWKYSVHGFLLAADRIHHGFTIVDP